MSETFTLLIGSNSRHLGQVTFDATANHLSLSETKEIGHRPSWIHIHKSVLVTNIEADIGKVVVFDGPSTPNDNLLNLSGLVHRFELKVAAQIRVIWTCRRTGRLCLLPITMAELSRFIH
ncbi:hypothetical protein BCR33DRAFT_467812 [Rhizoclosmatium globosum]|uniref:Uncharacterized protein n=1 Tax=Rhizoclosmatium globosum TaxID=329046 RepID=A0A1Y2BQG0_9FUNG|nr:hypothetical protein BCR33DRAFT_467812 [Rhizoclosmatium globosum]|eukprot:ORY36992.1 hypothetical protein BCR33DRAFT_467812 [Rhizoclosmatium globosum]